MSAVKAILNKVCTLHCIKCYTHIQVYSVVSVCVLMKVNEVNKCPVSNGSFSLSYHLNNICSYLDSPNTKCMGRLFLIIPNSFC